MAHSDTQRYAQQLADLDASEVLISTVLNMAAADARTCTQYDAPGARGYTFWTRANRYLAEQVITLKAKKNKVDDPPWKHTAKDNILRVIHPTNSHAITAISAEGSVGNLDGDVRSRNPKGSAMQALVERNGQFPLMSRDQVRWHKGIITAELSLPVRMNGAYVDEWLARIPIAESIIADPGGDISLDAPAPSSVNTTVEVQFLEG